MTPGVEHACRNHPTRSRPAFGGTSLTINIWIPGTWREWNARYQSGTAK
jgi:hypothetical protein